MKEPIEDGSYVQNNLLDIEQKLKSDLMYSLSAKIDKKNMSTRPSPAYPEPARRKLHWDHLTEEMAWLAGDYSREKKWRVKMSNKFAEQAKRKNIDEKSNCLHCKERSEIANQKRVAHFIASEIVSFWKKVSKVVEWKGEYTYEKAREKQLDIHFDNLVKKTEIYANSIISPNQNQEQDLVTLLSDLSGQNYLGEECDHDYSCEDSSSQDDERTLEEEVKMMSTQDLKSEKIETNILLSEGRLPIDEVVKYYEKFGYVAPKSANYSNLFQGNGESIQDPPFLLKHSLREYQFIGLRWLMQRYSKKVNGILADEMGLGKTIQTISLLAQLACEYGSWGPHLIVVPTSVMLNWEIEFKRFSRR